MALLIRFPLRLWLPLVIFLSLAGTLAVSVWSTQHYRHRHLYREARQDISAQALYLASEAEHMMRTTPRLMAHKPSQLYTDPQVAVVAVLDPDGRVLFAHRKEWQGLFLTALLSHFDANRLEKTVAGALPNVVERRDRARLSILHPYPFPASEGQLRSLKQGAVYLEYDLSPAVANIGVQVLTESTPIAAAILLVSIALAWILHQQITRPLESLRQATRELGRGNINTPIRMTGAAEFTELAQSFQGMANELENAMRNLISSREHLATTLHSIGDALIATDLEGRITLMNPIAETLTGWSFAEAKGQSVDRIFRIENTQTGCPAPIPVEQVIRTGKAMGLANHIGLIARDGKRYHIADSAAPIRDDRGQLTGVVMVFRDVTEAYRLREALAESELHYRTLADSGQALIWASSPDKRCTYFNHPWLAFTGRRLEEELGDGWTQGVHPDDLADCLATYEQAFDRREPFSLVYRLRRHDGTYRWIIDEAQPRYDSKGRFLGYIGHCLDITDLRQAQTEIEHRSAELEAILAALPDLFFLLDGEGRFLDFRAQNPSDLYLPPENFMGRRVSEVMPPQVSRDFQKALDKLRCSKQTVTQELELPFPQGKRWFEAHINQVANSDELVVLVRDISSRKNAEKEIHRLAYYDALTGLPNRHLLMEYLHHSLAGAQRSGHIGALLFIDLDQFKRVNDARGHQVGDRVLKQVGARLTRFLREGDMVARLGGDEFVVLLIDLADEREAAAHLARSIAQKVRITLQPPFNVDGVDYHIGASIGITVFPKGNENCNDLLREADTAMYQAKEAGRGGVLYFEPNMQREVRERLALEQDLHRAVAADELVLFLQPQVDRNMRLKGAEVLLRWRHPERGLVSPITFIPIAEESGLIQNLGDWVFGETARLLKHFDDTGHPLRLAVNVSPRQFRAPNFVDRLRSTLLHSGADPNHLVLEVTENLVIEDIHDTIAKMEELRTLGIHFAIDDFGTGYSSLAYLKRLPLKELKIDRTFTQDLPDDLNDAALVETILSVARHLNLEVVAEGVETRIQRDFLEERGCIYFQGYLFDRPLSWEEFIAKWRS